MRSGGFSYTVEAHCRPEAAVELLSTFTRHSALHPLIIAVDRLTDRPGMLRRDRITDRLVWGPFRFRIQARTAHAELAERMAAVLDGAAD